MGSVDVDQKSIGELLGRALSAVLEAPDRRVEDAVDSGASLLAASQERWPAVSRGCSP